VVPWVGEPEVTPADTLSLYFVAYPPQGFSGPMDLLLEFTREGQVVGRAAPALPRPDAKGTIPYIARIQAVKFSPGRYEIRAEFGAAGQRVEERASFRFAAAAAAATAAAATAR
jgi:hypothetical protein